MVSDVPGAVLDVLCVVSVVVSGLSADSVAAGRPESVVCSPENANELEPVEPEEDVVAVPVDALESVFAASVFSPS